MQKIDDVDKKILDILIDNTRTPFTEIAKRLLISPGTVHVRVKKLEDSGIIKGSSLNLDYNLLGYNFVAYIGVLADRSGQRYDILDALKNIPHVTVARCRRQRAAPHRRLRKRRRARVGRCVEKETQS